LYRGLSIVIIGSAPESALFFCTYEGLKKKISEGNPHIPSATVHMSSAMMAEVVSDLILISRPRRYITVVCSVQVACLIRVPTEVIKQRMQMGKGSISHVVGGIMVNQGWRGLFTGFGITIMREIPYAFIQFPIYEYFMVCPQFRGR
jgi:solute carrier family 25 (mitochondrial S-adenosylmethionine transporter), member 26